MHFFRLWTVAAVAVSISGCTLGNLNSIYREFSSAPGSDSQIIDVKQRTILQQRGPDGRTMVCAEPSPDALAVYGASVAAEGENPGYFSGSFSGSTTEAGTPFGIRTQSIQLLRDTYYRSCEAFMSGAIDKETYDTLIRRLNLQAMGFLAIEQITGKLDHASANVVSPELVGLYNKRKAALKVIEDETALIAARDEEVKKDPTKKPAWDAEKPSHQKKIDDAKTELAQVEKQIADAAKAIVEAPAREAESGVASVRAIQAAEKIALSVLKADYSLQMCFSRQRNEPSKLTSLDETCKVVLAAYKSELTARANVWGALSTYLTANCIGKQPNGEVAAICQKELQRWLVADANGGGSEAGTASISIPDPPSMLVR